LSLEKLLFSVPYIVWLDYGVILHILLQRSLRLVYIILLNTVIYKRYPIPLKSFMDNSFQTVANIFFAPWASY